MRKVAIGVQSFEALREGDFFYVDKTDFIRQWYENGDEVTLITRPRRFGKTLTLRMMECFFSTAYQGRGDLFNGLEISGYPKMMELQGTVPVIFISLLSVSASTYSGFLLKLRSAITKLYKLHAYLLTSDVLDQMDRAFFEGMLERCVECPNPIKEKEAFEKYEQCIVDSVYCLSEWLYQYYHKKVFVFIDEYDTPVQTAYFNHYHDEAITLLRCFFATSLKDNVYLSRTLMTGITMIAKESLFTDMNQLRECTIMDEPYADAFGFTQEEMATILEEYGIRDRETEIRSWYDGYNIGKTSGIYNPWTILQVLIEPQRELEDFWNQTGGVRLIDDLVRHAHSEFHETLQALLQNGFAETKVSKALVFPQLKGNTGVLWSLLLQAGYIKPAAATIKAMESVDNSQIGRRKAELKVVPISFVNDETRLCMLDMIERWYQSDGQRDEMALFVDALLAGDLEKINETLSKVVAICVSSFDSGVKPTKKNNHPENFFHGLTTGMVASLLGRYDVTSNGEAGSGRFDLCLEPIECAYGDAIIIEFKVFSAREGDKTIEDTAKRAKQQIIDHGYDEKLKSRGFSDDEIRKYGFGFRGKKVRVV